MAKTNLTARLVTAAVACPALLLLIFAAPAWAWLLAVEVVLSLSAAELLGMTHPRDKLARGVGIGLCMAFSLGVYFWSAAPEKLLALTFAAPLTGLLLTLWRLGDLPSAGLRSLAGAAAPPYVGMLTCIALVRRDLGAAGPGFALLTLLIAWMADTGGYFAGRSFGRTKLYEAVSPKKTREGLLGGIGAAMASAALAHYTFLPSLPLTHALALGCVGAFVGQAGDLVESVLKRSTAVKDSGSLLPGHGGLLDRIDGLLFVAPLVYFYARWAS